MPRWNSGKSEPGLSVLRRAVSYLHKARLMSMFVRCGVPLSSGVGQYLGRQQVQMNVDSDARSRRPRKPAAGRQPPDKTAFKLTGLTVTRAMQAA
jgi:hypothetical protein